MLRVFLCMPSTLALSQIWQRYRMDAPGARNVASASSLRRAPCDVTKPMPQAPNRQVRFWGFLVFPVGGSFVSGSEAAVPRAAAGLAGTWAQPDSATHAPFRPPIRVR